MNECTNAGVVYKILTSAQWEEATVTGAFRGSADDMRDGFIHLSSGPQLSETARRYFSNQPDLMLVAFEQRSLGAALRWEASRSGAPFPHLFAPLPTSKALWARPMSLDENGVPIVAEGVV